MPVIKSNMRQIMRDRKETYASLFKKCDLSIGTLYKMTQDSNVGKMKLENLAHVAKVLNVPIAEMYTICDQ